VEQELDKRQQLAALLAAPEKVTAADAILLRACANLYPYFQPVHLLLARATQHEPAKYREQATAALYTNGTILHDTLQRTEPLPNTSFNVLSQQAKQFTPPAGVSTDELVIENIATTDFFAFQEHFSVESAPDESTIEQSIAVTAEEIETAAISVNEVVSEATESIVISKYDDDQMPYTFLWWLAKTRKEYQQIFQPYASPKKPEAGEKPAGNLRSLPNELQHQYVEHIFHMQSPFDEATEESYTTEGFRKPAKGDELIESFIKNDPQISPPKPEQIDNENKAKKSAEDHNDLVSETLAKIYIEQMLYDKAIETYEKLSLKFPEKSRYFADLIQSIEKKI
jgi:hypothetical protein